MDKEALDGSDAPGSSSPQHFNSTTTGRTPLDQPGDAFYALVASTGLVILLTSLVGNLMVLAYYGGAKKRGRSMFIVCLAAAGLLKTAAALWMLTVSAIAKRWVFRDFGCQYYGFCMSITSLAEILLLAGIAVERWRAIVRPLEAARTTPRQKAGIVCLSVGIAGVISAAPLLGWGRYTLIAFSINCMFEFFDRGASNRSYIIFMFSGAFLLPVSIMTICYSHILIHIKRSRATSTLTATSNATATSNGTSGTQVALLTGRQGVSTRRERQMQLTVPLLLATVAFLIAWTPFSIMVLIAQFGNPAWITPYVATVTELFAKSSVVLNPFVYAFRDRAFSRAIARRLAKITGHSSNRTAARSSNAYSNTSRVAFRTGHLLLDVSGAVKIEDNDVTL